MFSVGATDASTCMAAMSQAPPHGGAAKVCGRLATRTFQRAKPKILTPLLVMPPTVALCNGGKSKRALRTPDTKG